MRMVESGGAVWLGFDVRRLFKNSFLESIQQSDAIQFSAVSPPYICNGRALACRVL